MSIITGRRLNYFYKKILDKIATLYASKSIYGDSTVSVGRNKGTTVGAHSASFGEETAATGRHAFSTGQQTSAAGDCAFSTGYQTFATGNYAFSGGDYTRASGTYAFTEGYSTEASGNAAHAEGYNTIAKGSRSHAEGNYTTALKDQHVMGHYNDETKATAGVETGAGDGTAFCIGNGISGTASNAVRIDYGGKVWCKKAYSSTGADYAELFEWMDGNPNNEDRRGYFVTMDNEKIKKAAAGDWILGIVSANPCILGNTDMEWKGQFLKDEFGDYIIEHGVQTVTETVYVTDTDGNVVLDDKGNPTTKEVEKEVPYQFYKVNPDYDPNEEYIFRLNRKEWDAVGMMGVLAVYDDGSCVVNGFCTCAAGGIATESETGYRVISRVNDHIVKVIVGV